MIQKRQAEIAFLHQVNSQDSHALSDLQSENSRLQKQLDELDKEYFALIKKIDQ